MKRNRKIFALFAAAVLSFTFTACESLDAMMAALDNFFADDTALASTNTGTSTSSSSSTQKSGSSSTSSSSSSSTTTSSSNSTNASTSAYAKPSSSLEFKGTPYTVLPSGTDGTVGKGGTYVLFGDWPQTIKANSVTVDESKYAVMGAYTYYKGNDGFWYAKSKVVPGSGSEGGKGYCFSDGTRVRTVKTAYFKVEPIKWRVLTANYNGSGKKLLLAESALISGRYYDVNGDATGLGKKMPQSGDKLVLHIADSLRTKSDGTLVLHGNYEYSRIRAYLNGLSYTTRDKRGENEHVVNDFVSKGFLQTAFTSELQSKIAVTNVDNSYKSTSIENLFDYSTYENYDLILYQGGNPLSNKKFKWPGSISNTTKDKVFLLSGAEITNKSYGFIRIPPKLTQDQALQMSLRGQEWNWFDVEQTCKELVRTSTDFAKANTINHNTTEDLVTGAVEWLTRTPGVVRYFEGNYYNEKTHRSVIVKTVGALEEDTVDADGKGIVPAICIN